MAQMSSAKKINDINMKIEYIFKYKNDRVSINIRHTTFFCAALAIVKKIKLSIKNVTLIPLS